MLQIVFVWPYWHCFSLGRYASEGPPAGSSAGGGCPLETETLPNAAAPPHLALIGSNPPIFGGPVEPWV